VYYHLTSSVVYQQKVRDSRFIAHCQPIASDEEVREALRNAAIEHKKATHICHAYTLFNGREAIGYASDAGEPRGSAGAPILQLLHVRRLVNSLCLVVRYFGGTKLGVGGLIRAYGGIAAQVLDMALKEEFVRYRIVRIKSPHPIVAGLMHQIQRVAMDCKPEYLPEGVMLTVRVAESNYPDLEQIIAALEHLSVSFCE